MASNIVTYFHCRKCIEELPPGVSAQQFQSVEVGLSENGHLVIWCKRHDILVGTFEPKSRLTYKCEKCEA